MKYCEKCKTGTDLQNQGTNYCNRCGTKIVDVRTKPCKCGAKAEHFYVYCTNCGKQLEPIL